VPKHILGDADRKTLVENDFSIAPVTSGAFSYNAAQTSAGDNKVYYLSENSDYYKGEPLLNSFAVHIYTTKEDIVRAINAGTVTATAELSGADADKITAGQFIQKNSSLSSGAFIFFNLKRDNIKKLELRNAIRQGISLEKIREAAPDTQALDYPLISSQIEISKYPGLPGYDAEASKAKIAELTADGPIHVDIATVNSGYLPNVAETIKTELETLGLEATVFTYEENQEFITSVISKRNYDILVYEVELGADPDLLPYYHSSQASVGGLNLSNYRDALVDDLLLGARDTLDEELRIKKYESFLERWVADAPAIGLYQPNLTYFYNKNVRTFGNDARLVTALDRFSDVTNWAVNKSTKNKTP
jgi:ABC-type transport system substrate-binding protein